MPDNETAAALRQVAESLDRIGFTSNVITDIGAIEALALKIEESNRLIADALSEVAEAVRYHADSRTDKP